MKARIALCGLLFMAALAIAPAEAQTVNSSADACAPSRRVRCPTTSEIIAAANAAARQRSSNARFLGARHIYAYAPGALYELLANPNYVSSVLLEPGEVVTAIAAGDTARWMVTEAQTEGAREPRAVVLVKPLDQRAHTNIVIITDRRTYVIDARAAGGETYAAEIAWSYPDATEAHPARVEELNFAYRIRTVRGARPIWAPARVFDDGRHTYVEFAPGVAVREMAPLFVVTGEGVELANYRVEGQLMIVDRLFERAELRMGRRAPVIVRIDREGVRAEPQRRTRRGGRAP